MLNKAAIDWTAVAPRERGWETDARPELRLISLFAGMAILLAAIGTRFVWVQTNLTQAYADDLERPTEKTEPIPTRDGRILTSDGSVLAEDELEVGINAHYRWIEEPPNPAWLRQQTLSRLERGQRRDRKLIEKEAEKVLELRSRMWDELARITGKTPDELAATRREIQVRVERIRERAEEQRWEARLRPTAASPIESPSWWRAAWTNVVETLTTPPRREAEEPLTVEEELTYHAVIPKVDPDLATRIESRPSQFPGLRVAESTRRVYRHGSTAPHVVGERKSISAEELHARRMRFPDGDPLDYRPDDRIGTSGLEKQYDAVLRGVRGVRKLTLNRLGEVLKSEETRPARPGRDVVLAMDLAFQKSAEQLLDEVLGAPIDDPVTGEPLPLPPSGSLIALDVRTGAILACASGPRFDLNARDDVREYAALQTDPRRPMFDRATQMELPPGSVFKTVSAVAFLESGQVDPHEHFFCQGYLERPDRYRCYTFRRFQTGHNEVTLEDALARSCNVYFFSHARQVGPEPIHDWAVNFGIGQKTGVDLPNERRGNLPAARPRGDGRRTGDTLQLSIGQAQLTVTPLQIARMMAAVANGGSLVTPRFVETSGSDLSLEDPEPIADLSPKSLHFVRSGLQQVVASPQGTGYKTVRMDRVAIAGKTGTAEPGGGRPDHAWFAGYVPAERPRIAFVVVLEHAGSGGHAAGPVARKFVQAMLDHGLLSTGTTAARR